MKTTDLIPLILYQLVDGDKYGYEIVKQIEDSSAGGIIIKQPTLYSVLKKLEQGKFISSYWQDSEIGGKRHYYKLTDNGKAQLDTYPSFEQLIKEVTNDDAYKYIPTSPALADNNLDTNEVDGNSQNNINAEIDYLDKNLENQQDKIDESIPTATFEFNDITDIKPIHIDLSSSISNNEEYNFSSSYIPENNYDTDNTLSSTSNEDINSLNYSEIKLDNNDLISQDFSTTSSVIENELEQLPINDSPIVQPITFNIFDAMEPANYGDKPKENFNNEIQDSSSKQNKEEDVAPGSKFTEKVEPINEPCVNNKLYSKLTPNEELIEDLRNNTVEEEYSSPIENIEQIQYLNYVDFNTDPNTIKRKTAIKKHIIKMSITCISLLIMIISTLILCNKYSYSKLYYISSIVVCLIVVLYPLILLNNIHKIRLKYCSTPFRYSTLRDFFVKLSIFLSLVIVIFAYNLSNSSNINEIFSISNCSSFLFPIIFASVIMLDWLYSMLLYKDYKN